MNAIRFLLSVIAVIGLTHATAASSAEPAAHSQALRTGIVTSQGRPLTLQGQEVRVGERAPDFTLLNREMKPVSLSDYAGKVRIITVFPSVDTRVCSAQVRRFNQEAASLDNVQIIAVSVDLPFALNRFCAAEGIDKIITLSDHRETDFGLKYGFLIEELRLLARGTVIVDQDGIVRYVEYVPKLGEEPDYGRAIEVAKSLAEKA